MSGELVLVTGGTGFIAQHCILALLGAGYRVRTTVRTLSREDEVRANLKVGGAEPGDRLEFVLADLAADEGWAEAAADCRFVLHGASPTPSGDQVREEDWVRPAVEGNLRVLRAARDAGVKRVVLTSAIGAVAVGHKPLNRPFNENDWSDLSGNVRPVAPYQKSKTIAEREAWAFIEREGRGLELAAVNPVAVLGPALGADYSHSIRIITSLMNGQPGCPKINSGFVDVRDVADLHLRAMVNPRANGQRYIAIAGHSLWMVDLARILKRRMGSAASRVSTLVLPNWIVRWVARRNPVMRNMVPLLGITLDATSDKAKRELGWAPRSVEDAAVATAESLIGLCLLVKRNA